MERPAREELRRLLDAFDTALDMDPGRREEWLANLDTNDPPFGLRLRELLAARDSVETKGFMREPAWNAVAAALAGAEPGAPASATEIGGYRLERELGVGGMGAVWLADRTDGLIKRPVALKLPHAGPFARDFAGRFARERAILAALEHPHIARLYDAGVTAHGQPYLALEYVEGERLDRWCDARALDVAARVRLFLDVLGAVQYAHGRLVVHRDLKPANILVTQDGRVKLLDFGIARLLADADPAASALTKVGGLAFTPDYAAPEQITGAPIGVASDVYSLGVVLYELLCGRRPYRLTRASRGALEDAIVSVEVQRPSEGAIEPAAAQRRATDAVRLRRVLRGDLDTIVLTALAKDPAARYPTCSAFADDLQRFLDGRPVLARPASRWYRARKFVLRHRWSVGAATAFVVLVSGAAVVAAIQAVKAREEAARADAIRRFVVGVFERNRATQPDAAKARTTTVRELLDLGRDELFGKPPREPAVAEALYGTFSEMYFQLGLEAESLRLDRARFELNRKAFGALDRRTLEAQRDLGQVLMRQGTNADELATLAADLNAKVERIGDPQLRAHAHALLAEVLAESDEPASFAHQKSAVELLRRIPGDAEFTIALGMLARKQMLRGDLVNARASIREALDAWSRLPGRGSMEAGELQTLLGQISEAGDELGNAETAYRRALAAQRARADAASWQAHSNWVYLGRLMARTGRAAEVVKEMADVSARIRDGDNAPPWFREWMLSVALEAATTAGDARAMDGYGAALQRAGCSVGDPTIDGWCSIALLEYQVARGKTHDAARGLQELESRHRALPPARPGTLTGALAVAMLQTIARAHLALDAAPKASEAVKEARQVLATLPMQPALLDLRLGLVERSVLLAQGDAGAAQALTERLRQRLAAHPDRALLRGYEQALNTR
jgi:serine/threonine-protein kinase